MLAAIAGMGGGRRRGAGLIIVACFFSSINKALSAGPPHLVRYSCNVRTVVIVGSTCRTQVANRTSRIDFEGVGGVPTF